MELSNMRLTFELDDDIKLRLDRLPYGSRKVMMNKMLELALDLADSEDIWRFLSAVEHDELRLVMENKHEHR